MLMRMVLGASILSLTTACGGLQERAKAPQKHNSFEVSFTGCSAEDPITFQVRKDFCSWAKTDEGKTCLSKAGSSGSKGDIGPDLYEHFCNP